MSAVSLYFQVHQPRRLRRFQAFDIGQEVGYFADYDDGMAVSNPAILSKVAKNCYLPTNKLFLDLLRKYPELKITYSLTGVFIRQMEEHLPQLLDSFKQLADTGQVEFLSETYYHSLASIYSEQEFIDQIHYHTQAISTTFGVTPTVLRNTELIYNNQVAEIAQKLGYKAVLAEGADKVLEWRSANFVYQAPNSLPILLKNYRLADDIAFRFSHQEWEHFPLTANRFAGWISDLSDNSDVVNLFLDYETFGEHHRAEQGIFDFLKHLPEALLSDSNNSFVTPSQAIEIFQPKDTLDIPYYTSWADQNRDLSAWLENDMQKHAVEKIYALRDRVLATQDEELIDTWRHLQTSDHFYYMCTRWAQDGDVHAYFSPFESPYTAFLSYMNVLQDFELKLEEVEQEHKQQQHPEIEIPIPAVLKTNPQL